MKKKLLLGLLSLLPLVWSGCSTTQATAPSSQAIRIQDYKREDYVLLDNLVGEAKSFRLWLLFFPIGGKSDEALQQEAYARALKAATKLKADGILDPRYELKKSTVPLILFGWTRKSVTAETKGFRLKSEAEYQASKVPAAAAPSSAPAAP
jgi:hypothetical protein